MTAAVRSAEVPVDPAWRETRRPLWLDGRRRSLVLRAARTALVVLRGSHRFTVPIARLSRIRVVGDVALQAEAVALCLQHRIPIVFESAQGEPAGAALPLRPPSSRLAEVLADLADSPHARPVYEHWRRRAAMRMLVDWRDEAARHGHPVQSGEFSERVRRHVYLGEPPMRRDVYAWAYSVTLGLLVEAGLPCSLRTSECDCLPLATDLAALLAVSVEIREGSIARAIPDTEALRAQALESQAGVLRDRLGGWIHRLQRAALDVLEPCL